MPIAPVQVSVTAPLTPALERMKWMLFRPFDFERWIVIGFAAWLAQLGQGGGGGAGFNFNFGHHNGPAPREVFEQVRDYILNNLSWIVPVAVGVGGVLLAIWLVLVWLSSRGQFLFLHCTASNRAEIIVPWTRFGWQANSLFLFRAALGLISFALMLPFLVWCVWLFDQMMRRVEGSVFGLVVYLLGGIAGAASVALLSAAVRVLLIDFVVPVMYVHSTTCLAAWRRVLDLVASQPLNILLYLLFSLLLAIVIGLGIAAIVLATCCLAGCLLAIPYIGTVALLPVLLFRRSYSLYYLAQYGLEFDAFAATGTTAGQIH